MAGNANKIDQIYNLSALGGGKVISELEAIVELFKTIEQIKIRLNKMKDGITDPGTIRRVNDELNRQTKAYQNNIVKMNLMSSQTLKLASHNKELVLKIIQVNDEVENVTDALNDLNKAELKALQETTEWANQQTKLANETKKVTTAISKEITSINTLNAENKLLRKERDALDLSTAAGVARAKQLNDAIIENTAIISKNQDAVVKQKMNIGNYGSALTKVWSGLRQFAYILPGLGIAGIFNIVFDAIGPVIERLLDFNGAAAKMRENLKAIAKDVQENGSKELATAQQLYTQATDLNLTYAQRKSAVDELQKLYPSYLGNLKDEAIMAGKAKDAYNELTQALVNKAIYESLTAQAAEIAKPLTPLLIQLDSINSKIDAIKEAGKGVSIRGYSVTGNQSTEGAGRLKEMEQEAEELRKKIKVVQTEMQKLFTVAGKFSNDLVNIPEGTKNDKKAADAARKAAEDRAKIVFEARLALLDAQAAEELKLASDHEEDMKTMLHGSAQEKAIVEEGYQTKLKAIRDKYAKAFYDGIFDLSLDEKKRMEKEAETKLEGERKTQQHMLDIVKDSNKEIQAENDKAYKEAVDKQKAHDLEMEQFRKQVLNDAYNLAREYSQSQSQIKQQEVNNEFELRQEYLQSEKEKRLAQAQSAAEKQAIEEEYDKKAKESERKRNVERQEIAKKQIAIEFALASIKIWAGEGTWYTKLAQEAMLLGQYLVALQNINSQQFEQGGQVPTNTGGDIIGPSHASGGVPFGFEAEGGEMAIINKKSTMDKGTYSLTGTPRQIASAINEIGGGIKFAPGAKAMKFEYGGMLGNNLNAPMLGRQYGGFGGSGSIDTARLEAIFSGISNVISMESRKPIVLDTRGLSRQQDRTAKQVQLGTV